MEFLMNGDCTANLNNTFSGSNFIMKKSPDFHQQKKSSINLMLVLSLMISIAMISY